MDAWGIAGFGAWCWILCQAKVQSKAGEVSMTTGAFARGTGCEREQADRMLGDMVTNGLLALTDEQDVYGIPGWAEYQPDPRPAGRERLGHSGTDWDKSGQNGTSRTTGRDRTGRDRTARDKTGQEPRTPDIHSVSSEIKDPDTEAECDLLADLIERNGSKRPRVTKAWRESSRLLREVDGRTHEQVMTCIQWCQADEFWRGNVLSMPKLREKYDQMRLQAQRSPQGKQVARLERAAEIMETLKREAG